MYPPLLSQTACNLELRELMCSMWNPSSLAFHLPWGMCHDLKWWKALSPTCDVAYQHPIRAGCASVTPNVTRILCLKAQGCAPGSLERGSSPCQRPRPASSGHSRQFSLCLKTSPSASPVVLPSTCHPISLVPCPALSHLRPLWPSQPLSHPLSGASLSSLSSHPCQDESVRTIGQIVSPLS